MRRMGLLGAAAALSLATAAAAQTQQPQDPAVPPPQGANEPQDQTHRGTALAEREAPPASGGAFHTSDQHRTSKLVGIDVQTSTGDSVGKVEDLVLDASGRITHAIVSHGGTLGVGAKLTAVPWQVVASRLSGDKLILEQEQIKQSPSFQNGRWPNLTSANWSRQFDQYWRQQPDRTRMATAPTESGQTQPPSQSQPPQPPTQTQPSQESIPSQEPQSSSEPPLPQQTQPAPGTPLPEDGA